MTIIDDDPVRAEYARLARQYDRHWSFYVSATLRETLCRLAVQPEQRILDVGCGTGSLMQAILQQYPRVKLTGIDPCAEMLQIAAAKLHSKAELRRASADALPFPAAAFDAVVCTSSFHYFRQPARALAEMKRVLRPRGCLVITDWCRDYWTCRVCDWLLHRFNAAHYRTYRARDCLCLLREAGFEEVSIDRYKISWLWGLMTAVAVNPVP